MVSGITDQFMGLFPSTNISGEHYPVWSWSVKIGCVQELETSIHPITGYLLKIEHSPPRQEYTVYMSIWVLAELIETKWNVQLQRMSYLYPWKIMLQNQNWIVGLETSSISCEGLRVNPSAHFLWSTKWSDYAWQGLPKSIGLRKQSTEIMCSCESTISEADHFLGTRTLRTSRCLLISAELEVKLPICTSDADGGFLSNHPSNWLPKRKMVTNSAPIPTVLKELQKDPLFFSCQKPQASESHRKSRTLVWNSQALHLKGWHWKPFDMYTGWWLTYPSEKYELVSWGWDDIPYMKWKMFKNVWNHQPDNILLSHITMENHHF